MGKNKNNKEPFAKLCNGCFRIVSKGDFSKKQWIGSLKKHRRCKSCIEQNISIRSLPPSIKAPSTPPRTRSPPKNPPPRPSKTPSPPWKEPPPPLSKKEPSTPPTESQPPKARSTPFNFGIGEETSLPFAVNVTEHGQRISTEDATERKESKFYEVRVPWGIQPGTYFHAMADGFRTAIRCPPNARMGQRIRFLLPPPELSPKGSSNGPNHRNPTESVRSEGLEGATRQNHANTKPISKSSAVLVARRGVGRVASVLPHPQNVAPAKTTVVLPRQEVKPLNATPVIPHAPSNATPVFPHAPSNATPVIPHTPSNATPVVPSPQLHLRESTPLKTRHSRPKKTKTLPPPYAGNQEQRLWQPTDPSDENYSIKQQPDICKWLGKTEEANALLECRSCTEYSSDICAWCGKTEELKALRVCGGCKNILYCSRTCQKASWPHHKKTCRLFKKDRKLTKTERKAWRASGGGFCVMEASGTGHFCLNYNPHGISILREYGYGKKNFLPFGVFVNCHTVGTIQELYGDEHCQWLLREANQQTLKIKDSEEDSSTTLFTDVTELPRGTQFCLCCGPLNSIGCAKEILRTFTSDFNSLKSSIQTFESFVPRGYKLNALEWAARRGNYDIAEWLASDPRTRVLLASKTTAPVAWACLSNRVELARMLVRYGADPSATTKVFFDHKPALHAAAERGHLQAVRFLVEEMHQDIDLRDGSGLGLRVCLRKHNPNWKEIPGCLAVDKYAKVKGSERAKEMMGKGSETARTAETEHGCTTQKQRRKIVRKITIEVTIEYIHLRREDFDNIMIDFFLIEFIKKSKMNMGDDTRSLRLLKLSWKRAKHTLSYSNIAYIMRDRIYGDIDFKAIIACVNRPTQQGMESIDNWKRLATNEFDIAPIIDKDVTVEEVDVVVTQTAVVPNELYDTCSYQQEERACPEYSHPQPLRDVPSQRTVQHSQSDEICATVGPPEQTLPKVTNQLLLSRHSDFQTEGLEDGLGEGDLDGLEDGNLEGLEDGLGEGNPDGLEDSNPEGLEDTLEEGNPDGLEDGAPNCCCS